MSDPGTEDNPKVWAVGEVYAPGEFVVRSGVLYRANSWHRSDNPIDPELYHSLETGEGLTAWPWTKVRVLAAQMPSSGVSAQPLNPAGPTPADLTEKAKHQGAPITDTATATGWPYRGYYGGSSDRCGPSEFSWGPGNCRPGYETKSPAEGGAYVGPTPRQNSDGTWPIVKRGLAYGVPGERLR